MSKPEPQAKAAAKVEAPAKALPTHVLMKHQDGGSCDAHEADKDGNHLVPIENIAEMLSHGFEVVGTAA